MIKSRLSSNQALLSIFCYSFAILVISASNFFTTPLLLSMLGNNEFAVWARIEPLILTAIPIAGLGMQIGLLNEYNKNRHAYGEIVIFHLLSSVFVAVSLGGFSWVSTGKPYLALATGAICFVEGSISLSVAQLRAGNRPLLYALVEGGRSASVLGALLLLAKCHVLIDSTLDYMLIRFVLGTLFLVFGILLLNEKWKPRFFRAKDALIYGLPIVISSMMVAIIMNFDRYAVTDQNNLPSYVAHVKSVQILGSALAPFFTWYAPVAMRYLNAREIDFSFFRRSFFVFGVINISFSLGLWLITPVLWQYLFPNLSIDRNLLAVLIIGLAVFSFGNPLSVGVLKEGQTNWSLVVTLASASVGGVFAWLGGQMFGALGVAAGKSFAMFLYSALFGVITLRKVGINFPWLAISAPVTVSFALAIYIPQFISDEHLMISLICATISSLGVIAVGGVVYVFCRGFRASSIEDASHYEY